MSVLAAMSADDRLRAMEQAMQMVQNELVMAKAAAGVAEKRADAAEIRNARPAAGLVDTRVLGKPRNFDGHLENWRSFKLTFLGYAGAVNADLRAGMVKSEALAEGAIINSALGADDQKISTQLYYLLVLLLEGGAQRLLEHAGDGEGLLSWNRLVAEYEPAAAGRETAL